MDSSKFSYRNANPATWNRPNYNYNSELYANPIIPPRVLIPASIDSQLNAMVSNAGKSRFRTDSRENKKKVTMSHTYFSSSTPKTIITTTQPPTIWFPGNPDCSNQGKEGENSHEPLRQYGKRIN